MLAMEYILVLVMDVVVNISKTTSLKKEFVFSSINTILSLSTEPL